MLKKLIPFFLYGHLYLYNMHDSIDTKKSGIYVMAVEERNFYNVNNKDKTEEQRTRKTYQVLNPSLLQELTPGSKLVQMQNTECAQGCLDIHKLCGISSFKKLSHNGLLNVEGSSGGLGVFLALSKDKILLPKIPIFCTGTIDFSNSRQNVGEVGELAFKMFGVKTFIEKEKISDFCLLIPDDNSW